MLFLGGICHGGRSDLVVLNGSMNARIYRDQILDNHVLPLAGAIGNAFTLVDDNFRPHRAQIMDNFLENQVIERMDWPAKSPDLNPIENIWGIMKRKISRRLTPSTSLQELQDMLFEE